jgi:hypothetical protein
MQACLDLFLFFFAHRANKYGCTQVSEYTISPISCPENALGWEVSAFIGVISGYKGQ